MAGLFDTYKSPDEVKRGIRTENIALDRSAPTGWQAISSAAYGGGRGLAQGLGGEDPRVGKAQKLQQIQQQLVAEGWEEKAGTPEFFAEIARRVAPVDPQMAMQAAMQGKELERKMKMEGLQVRDIESKIAKRERPEGAKPTPFMKNYEYLKSAKGEKAADKYFNKFVSTGVREGKLIKERLDDGTVGLFDNAGQLVTKLSVDGKPVTTAAHATEQRIASQGERGLGLREKREQTRAGSLKLRQVAHTDKLYKGFAKEFRNDTKVLKGMSEEIEGALTTISKKDFTGADAKLLQRQLAAVRKANTKAQAEIVAWKPGETGDVIQRIEGMLTGFLAGEYSETELNLMKDSLNNLMDNYVNPAYQRYDEHYSMKSKRHGLKVEEVIPERFKGESEDWITRAMKTNNMPREQVIQEGIRRGKLNEGYK